jgi:hypothetical protein
LKGVDYNNSRSSITPSTTWVMGSWNRLSAEWSVVYNYNPNCNGQ